MTWIPPTNFFQNLFLNKLFFFTSAYKIMSMPGVGSSKALVQTSVGSSQASVQTVTIDNFIPHFKNLTHVAIVLENVDSRTKYSHYTSCSKRNFTLRPKPVLFLMCDKNPGFLE